MDSTAQAIRIGIPIFQEADLLDVTAPMEVLALIRPAPEIWLVSQSGAPVRLEPSLDVNPRGSFANCPQFDVLVVPGGTGVTPILENRIFLEFLQLQARNARWVTAICAGALLLGAAKLLEGHTATTHWASLPALRLFPRVTAAPAFPRYVISGNRITTGGVTSALDMSIVLAAILADEQQARNAELLLEYAPQPPYSVGNPRLADATTLRQTTSTLKPMIQERMEVIRRITRP